LSQSSGFAAITFCVAPQQAIPKVSIYFIIDSAQKLLDTPSYVPHLPTDEQNENCLCMCHDLQQGQDDPHFLSDVTAGDKT
jgi:hypothetical protein